MEAAAVEADQTARKPFFTVPQAARYLGLSERTMWEMVSNGVIASYKFRTARSQAARRIAAEDLDAYVAGCREEGR